jgi:hypothetical protein
VSALPSATSADTGEFRLPTTDGPRAFVGAVHVDINHSCNGIGEFQGDKYVSNLNCDRISPSRWKRGWVGRDRDLTCHGGVASWWRRLWSNSRG